ncbi:MAG: GC-type dockerin domain-anchored protein, partial [Planctomycetota bacterium]
RNKIAGDFNADEARDADDIADIVEAYEERFEGGPSWTPPSGLAGSSADFILDVVGDFNGDGNFDIIDARYFMDGLAIDTATGNLDRHAAFLAADLAIINSNNGMMGGWADGDINGDGIVDGNDVEDFNNLNPCDGTTGRLCADQNGDGAATPGDFNAWVLNFNNGDLRADTNQNGVLEPGDFNAWILAFNAGANGPTCNP